MSLLEANNRVVIVDDNKQYSMLLERLLQGAMGYLKVDVFSSLAAAKQKLEAGQFEYSLAFIDYNFPGEERGATFIKLLKDKGILNRCTAFLITSEPTADNLKEAHAAGAFGVVAKPFDRVELKKKIEAADRSRRAVDADSF